MSSLSQFRFGGMVFERSATLGGRESLMKAALELHCGKCRIQGF